MKNFRQKSVDIHQFSMVPAADVPRAAFKMESMHKTTFDSGFLIPVYEDEVLPGDSFSLSMTAFARMSTPLFPVMDNLIMESFFFFVPLRLIHANFKKMMGEQDNPGDSISYTVPQQVTPAGGYAVGSLQDYFGLPTAGQVGGGNTVSHAAYWPRAYNLIWNTWYRDENMQNSVTVDTGDGPDNVANYVLLRRGKRKDYFTSALPWPQKGATAVTLPLGTSAPVIGNNNAIYTHQSTGTDDHFFIGVTGSQVVNFDGNVVPGAPFTRVWGKAADLTQTGLIADLSNATAATINALRTSFQIQKLLERDARGGTRYTEIVRSHFRVVSPDARLQRPEYLGGSSSHVNINPIAQTAQTGLTGGNTPLGSLAAMATTVHRAGFTQSFTEHGVIIGMVAVRADLSYQQGLRRMWSRSTRYDFYWPAFAMLGEQSILNKEIYCDGSGNDPLVFGYAARWDDYRYHPSKITGLFRSTSAGAIDGWHLAQKFTALPALNSTFIQDTPPVSRVLAVGAGANGQQFIFDSKFVVKAARPLPLFSVPGLIDHF